MIYYHQYKFTVSENKGQARLSNAEFNIFLFVGQYNFFSRKNYYFV